jgi:hypothetical protein
MQFTSFLYQHKVLKILYKIRVSRNPANCGPAYLCSAEQYRTIQNTEKSSQYGTDKQHNFFVISIPQLAGVIIPQIARLLRRYAPRNYNLVAG